MPENYLMSKNNNIFWTWREIPLSTPDSSHIKTRSETPRRLLQIAIMLIVGAFLFFRWRHRLAGGLVWTLAAVILAGMVFCPKIPAWFDRISAWVGRAVGVFITWLLLLPMFYTVFTLGRLVLWLRGHDPMERRLLPQANTYWNDRAPITDPEHWSRQY
jgi:hypothetical protein